MEARATFKIINDGYENLNLEVNIPQELGHVPLTLDFPEGTHLGVTKQKLKVEAIFISDKPMSFTREVEFKEGKRTYKIFVSGTTDNCLFTNYSFIQRSSRGQFS